MSTIRGGGGLDDVDMLWPGRSHYYAVFWLCHLHFPLATHIADCFRIYDFVSNGLIFRDHRFLVAHRQLRVIRLLPAEKASSSKTASNVHVAFAVASNLASKSPCDLADKAFFSTPLLGCFIWQCVCAKWIRHYDEPNETDSAKKLFLLMKQIWF